MVEMSDLKHSQVRGVKWESGSIKNLHFKNLSRKGNVSL